MKYFAPFGAKCLGVPPVAAHFDSDVTQRRRGALPSPWGRWRGAVLWHCTVTDEGSPLKAGLTAVRTTDIEIKESRLTAGFFYFSDIRRQAREKNTVLCHTVIMLLSCRRVKSRLRRGEIRASRV